MKVAISRKGQEPKPKPAAEYADALVAYCPHCRQPPGEPCGDWNTTFIAGNVDSDWEPRPPHNSHYSRWQAAQGVEIARLRALVRAKGGCP